VTAVLTPPLEGSSPGHPPCQASNLHRAHQRQLPGPAIIIKTPPRARSVASSSAVKAEPVRWAACVKTACYAAFTCMQQHTATARPCIHPPTAHSTD